MIQVQIPLLEQKFLLPQLFSKLNPILRLDIQGSNRRHD